jgi:hypothetical protein
MVLLDKYYTRKEIVYKCLDVLLPFETTIPSAVIEPSAGNGAFIKAFREKNPIPIVGYDIQPDDPMIISKDFLTLKIDDFKRYGNFILCLGNPPFGKQNNLAIKFFNHCASIPNVYCIAMIFPKSFRKESIQNRLNLWFHLEKEFDLDHYAFESADQTKIYDIPCIFQIWFRKNIQRIRSNPEKLNSDQFEFISKSDIKDNEYILSLRRVGFYAGKAKLFNDENNQSHYFIRCKTKTILDKVLTYLNDIVWSFEDTVGPRSISKQQFIHKLNNLRI